MDPMEYSENPKTTRLLGGSSQVAFKWLIKEGDPITTYDTWDDFAPKNGCLELFPFGGGSRPIFRGELAVSFMEGKLNLR